MTEEASGTKLPTTMHSAAQKNDDLIELLVLKRKLAKAIDKCDSLRDLKALALEYRATLEDIRKLGIVPEDEESPTTKALKSAGDYLN